MGRRWVVAVAALGCAALAACGSSAAPAPTLSTAPPPSPSSSVFLPMSSSDVFVPGGGADRSRPVPVVLTVPGGSWQTANREYMAPLAQRIAESGAFVVNATYRAGDVGARFPVALQDVRCDAAYAVAAARAAGWTPGPLVIVGHSAGGHLVALAGVSGDALAVPCTDPMPHIDGVVGLAGVYDTKAASSLIEPFFGVPYDADPQRWQSGDPIHYVTTGATPKPLSVLLVHGESDAVVPLAQSQSFAKALRAAGIPVRLEALPDQDHMSVVDPAVSADLITSFVQSLAKR